MKRYGFTFALLAVTLLAVTMTRSEPLTAVQPQGTAIKTYEWQAAPSDDRDRESLDQGADWCPATVIPSVPYIDFGTTTGSTNDWNPSCAQCCQAEDVIYQFTPTFTTVYRVSMCLTSSFDSILEIRTDGACPGSTQVACSDDVCGAQAQVDVEMIAGTTYYIIVDAYFQSDGPYILEFISRGYGTESCPAAVISSLPYTDIGTTIYSADNFSYCSGGLSPDVIYELTAPATANYTFSLCGSSYPTRLFLNTGGACPGNTQVYCGVGGCPISGRTQFTTLLYESLTYYIIVDGHQDQSGNYVLNVTRELTCDSCEADSCPATMIPSIPYVDAGTTTGKANNFFASNCGGQNAPDVIYSLSVPTTQYVVAYLSDEALPFRHTLALRAGSTCPGTNVECNFPGNNGGYASLTFQAAAFQTYYLVIDGISTFDGDYILHVDNLCSVVQQPGDLVECAETPSPGTVHQVVDCDGGCNNVFYGGVATFMNVVPGQTTVFGKMFTYYGFQPRPDTDWYQFTIAQRCSLSLAVSAEFPWHGLVFPAGCGSTYYHFLDGPACSTTTFIEQGSPFHVLPAGTYNLRFQAQQDTMIPTMLDYRLRIDKYIVCDEDGVINAPGSYSSNTCGEGDDCTLDLNQRADTDDRLVRINIPQLGEYTISLCSSAEPWPNSLTLLTSCCTEGFILAQATSGCTNGMAQLTCVALDPGSYFVLVENDDSEGPGQCTNDFTLTVSSCECQSIDSLTIKRLDNFNVFLNFYVPQPGYVRFYYASNPAAVYPAGFFQIDQFHPAVAGRYDNYEISALGLTGRYVVTIDSCGR